MGPLANHQVTKPGTQPLLPSIEPIPTSWPRSLPLLFSPTMRALVRGAAPAPAPPPRVDSVPTPHRAFVTLVALSSVSPGPGLPGPLVFPPPAVAWHWPQALSSGPLHVLFPEQHLPCKLSWQPRSARASWIFPSPLLGQHPRCGAGGDSLWHSTNPGPFYSASPLHPTRILWWP